MTLCSGSGALQLDIAGLLLARPRCCLNCLAVLRLLILRIRRSQVWVSHVRLAEACLSRRRSHYLILPRLIVQTWLLPVCTPLFRGLSLAAERDWPSDIGLRSWHPQPRLGRLRIKAHLVGERLTVNLPDRGLHVGLPWHSFGIRRDNSGELSVG